MLGNERKQQILEILQQAERPISATVLAKELSVSRQIIVGDVALLRAAGENIVATPRGYLLGKDATPKYMIVCQHGAEMVREELYTIVDCGCGIVDVQIEHAIYGQIIGTAHIFSRSDADNFCDKMESTKMVPLSAITNDVHSHTITCPSDKHFAELQEKLRALGVLIEESVNFATDGE